MSSPEDVADKVAVAWAAVHENLGDAAARVPREAFVEYCKSSVPEDSPKKGEYEAYLNKLFDAATAMMLPAEKSDLGKHCFGYATILADEFYFDQPADKLALKADEKPSDRLAPVRKELDADWESVEKDADGRVTLDAFVEYFLKKHADKVASESRDSYKAFLEKDFSSALAMMLPDEKTNLGGHCFRYASIMAGEFYFDTSAPVADILKIVQTSGEPKPDLRRTGAMDAEQLDSLAAQQAPAEDDGAAAEKAAAEAAEAEKAAAEAAEKEKAAAEAAKAEKAAAEKAAAEKAAAEKAAAEKAAAEKKAAEEKAAKEAAEAEKAAAEKAAAEKAEADKAAAAPAKKKAGASTKYSLEVLQTSCPEGVPPDHKEDFLNDEEFETALKMSRADFAKLPEWKRKQAKQNAKIF